MSAILNDNDHSFILDEIQSHPAWLGCISGLKAEKLLRGQQAPYVYVLRAGEYQSEVATDFYVTYVDSDLSIIHRPFVITITPAGWCFSNSVVGGPYISESIEDVLFTIMHCERGQNIPFIGCKAG